MKFSINLYFLLRKKKIVCWPQKAISELEICDTIRQIVFFFLLLRWIFYCHFFLWIYNFCFIAKFWLHDKVPRRSFLNESPDIYFANGPVKNRKHLPFSPSFSASLKQSKAEFHEFLMSLIWIYEILINNLSLAQPHRFVVASFVFVIIMTSSRESHKIWTTNSKFS